jgi:hypothetical protein
MKSKARFLSGLLILAAILSACGGGPGAGAPRDATVEAISAAVRGTATVEAAARLNPNAAVETAQADANLRSQSLDATQAAQAALSDEARAATATAFAPFIADLPKYGVDPEGGRPGWIHPPVTLEVDGYMQYDYVNQFIATVARDFVVSSDITWNTQYGTSGCGFVLRSDGNKNALNQYLTIATRGASGHVLFATMSNGDIVGGRDIYAYGIDPNFNWENNATNRLTVVGRGNTFTIYSNDTLIGEIDPGAPSCPARDPAAAPTTTRRGRRQCDEPVQKPAGATTGSGDPDHGGLPIPPTRGCRCGKVFRARLRGHGGVKRIGPQRVHLREYLAVVDRVK